MIAAAAFRSAVVGMIGAALLTVSLVACKPASGNNPSEAARVFPKADRPVSSLGGNGFSTERDRDIRNEANTVMDLAAIKPGSSVADLGAGDGYYTVRLAERVGKAGRVLAQDIDSNALSRLGLRVEKERLNNVSIKQGTPDDPGLPEGSFDRVFMVHMYHEVAEPYAFAWRIWPALKPGGRLVVVDVDRSSDKHGIPPALLICELEAVGFRFDGIHRKPELAGYYAQFAVAPKRPEPGSIRPCRLKPAKSANAPGR